MALEVRLLNPKGKLAGKPYEPWPTQAKFHGSNAIAAALLGGMGTGKSQVLLMEVLIQALEGGEGWKGLITRSTWEKLESATWPMFLKCIPPEIKAASGYRERQRPYPQVFFPNKAEVRGMNLDDPEKFGSEEYSIQAMDECGEDGCAEEHFLWMIGRRRNYAPGSRRVIRLAGHPSGRNWVWKHFFAWQEDPSYKRNPKFEGFQISAEETADHYDADYLQTMRDTYPDAWLARYLAGDFGLAEGQILTEFDPEIHWVPPFELKPFWPRYRALDHGINHPTAVLWGAVDLEGNLIIYREHLKRNTTPRENAQAVLAASLGEEEATRWTVADPATRQQQTAGGVIQRVIDQYREAGLVCREGNHDVKASIVLLKGLLKPDPARYFPYWHPLKGQPGAPKLFFTAECPRLRWEIEQWKWKKINPGKVDRETPLAVDDDAIAALRYLAMERPQNAVWTPPPTRNQMIDEMLAELAAEDGRSFGEFIGSERARQ